MIKIYSKGCEQVLRAIAMISAQSPMEPFSIKDLCKKAKVSEASTRKGFQSLASCGLLDAVSGPGGGYRLSVSPEKITIYQIVLGVDGETAFDQCIMGLPSCSKANPCPIHNSWSKLKKNIITELKNQKLSDLISIHIKR